ncbi:MAG: UvrD-helicase domain-containing protein, partial [Candidatus Krumholzibacteriota bacterium]|nr:UvrD-helicase domain-containing protein [Candidatus Krumholzibacteriota bacterium]
MTSLQLNPPQAEAVRHDAGPCLVIAGAGSGKTRVLTERIRRLVNEGTPPWRILGFTFTNKAAGEMRERLEASLGERAARLWLGTFHATGLRILRREGEAAGAPRDFTIYDADDQLALMKRMLRELALPDGSITPQAALALIERLKSRLLSPAEAAAEAGGFRDAQAARIYEAYQRGLRRARALDFTDLIALPVRRFAEDPPTRDRWSGRFDQVLVDEFQDTNPLQMRFIEQLAAASGNLFVVGDDDQSIYGWRGADISHILDFEGRFPGTRVIRLEQNYRSTRPILEAANAVIAHNRRRKGKELWTAEEAGQPVRVVTTLDEEEEAETVARRIVGAAGLEQDYGRFAVLYRTHAQSRALEASLGRHRLPYQIVGGTRFYDRKEVRDLLAYLKLAANPADGVSLDRVLNVPPRGIGKTTQARLRELAGRHNLAPGLLLTAFPERLAELPDAAARRVGEFGRLLLSLSPRPAVDAAPAVLERLIEKVPYLEWLAESDPVRAEVRRENVQELLSAAQAFYEARQAAADADDAAVAGDGGEAAPPAGAGGTAAGRTTGGAPAPEDLPEIAGDRPGRPGSLLDFLAEVALVADVDSLASGAEAVTLMTLHNAKGLEFDTVFLCGAEEQLLPHAMSSDDEDEVEEERRLFYVGCTRARRRLWVLHALNRRRYGDTLPMSPSRFLDELPEEWIEREGQENLAGMRAGLGGAAGWDRYGGWNGRQRAAGGRGIQRDGGGWNSGRRGAATPLPVHRAPVADFAGDGFRQDAGGDDFAGEFDQEEPAL